MLYVRMFRWLFMAIPMHVAIPNTLSVMIYVPQEPLPKIAIIFTDLIWKRGCRFSSSERRGRLGRTSSPISIAGASSTAGSTRCSSRSLLRIPKYKTFFQGCPHHLEYFLLDFCSPIWDACFLVGGSGWQWSWPPPWPGFLVDLGVRRDVCSRRKTLSR